MKIVFGRSTLVAGLACFVTLTGWGQVTAVRSLASDPRTGSVYSGSGAIVMNIGGNSWAASIDGATSINALALSPDGDAVYAAGNTASGAGFVVRLNAADGGVAARLDLGTAVLALAVGADGAIYTGGNLVRKMSPQLETIFALDPSGVAVGLAADPADGALYAAINAGGRAFAAKLSPDGSTWLYRSAAGPAMAAGLAYDGEAIYLTGSTDSLDFPVKNAAQDRRDGTSDAFVTKFSAADGAVIWSTYLGGRGADGGAAIAMGEDGSRLIIAGWTTSFDFPGAAAEPWWHGGEDGFVTEMDAATGRALDSEFIGTALDERVRALAVSGGQINAGGTMGLSRLAAKGSLKPRSPSTTAPVISFPQIPYQPLGTPPFTLNATQSGKLFAGTFASLTKSVCTVSGKTATLVAVGTCTIQATAPGVSPTPVTATQSFSVTSGPVTTLAIVTGSTPQTTSPGTAYPQPLAVVVKDAGNNPVLSANVTFTAPASGASGLFSNNAATVSVWTNAAGVASVPFTTNATAGSFTVTAAGGGLTATFALASAAGKMTPNAGTTPQAVNLSSTLGSALGVTVTVANAPLSGVPVTFTAPAAGASGTFSNGTATITVTTNANGVALASFQSNATAGSYKVNATAPGMSANFSLANSAVTTAASPASAKQNANTGTAFALPLAVVVRTPNASSGKPNADPGVSVTFTAPSSGASGLFSNHSTTITVLTDSTGTASAPFTANSKVGPYLVMATSPNLAAVYFSLANAGAPASVTPLKGTTPQITNINKAFPTALEVTVLDTFGTPVTAAAVTFTAPASGPSGKFSNGTPVITIATAVDGTATVPFTANGSGGPGYVVTAAVAGVNTAQFSLMNAGTPVSMTANPGSTPQSMQIYTSPGIGLAVTIKDAFNNPVPGVAVTFTVPTSGPSLELTEPTVATVGSTPVTISTSNKGVALVPVVESNGTLGSYTVTASATGLAPVKFTLTNLQGGVCILAQSPYNQQVNLGGSASLSATAVDCGGNLLPNIPVTFTAPASGASGTFSNGSNAITLATNAAGVASVTFTANQTGGPPYGIYATTSYLSVIISMANAGPPAHISCASGCFQSTYVGTTFAPIQLYVTDAWNTPVGGATVTLTAVPNQYDTNKTPASAYFLSSGGWVPTATATTNGINAADWGYASFTATPNCTPSTDGFEFWTYTMSATSGGATNGGYDSMYFTNQPLAPWVATCTANPFVP